MTGLLYIFPLTSAYLQSKDKENQTNITAALQKLDKVSQPLVIYGDELCGKTLLLFQAAVSYASQGHHVTFVSRRPLTRMPLSVHGMMRPDAAGLLKTLTFLYMSTADELVKYCSTVHTRTLLPEVLIVDDLEYYLSQLMDPSLEAGAARLCALLVDSANFLKTKSDQKRCILLMGCRSCRKTNLISILKQFNINIASITAVNLQDRYYALSMKTRDIDVQISFTLQGGGLFLENTSFVT